MKLTQKQLRFVAEYLVDLNATQAAIRAGYSSKRADAMGYENLRKPEIAAAIQAGMTERARRTEITQDYVLSTIKATIERCAQAMPVLDRDGAETGEYKFDAGAVLKGAELLGKHLKMFTDKTELSGKDGGPIDANLTVTFIKPNGR